MRCCRQANFGGLLDKSERTGITAGMASMPMTASVQNQASGKAIHPSSKSSVEPPAQGCAEDCPSASISTTPTAD